MKLSLDFSDINQAEAPAYIKILNRCGRVLQDAGSICFISMDCAYPAAHYFQNICLCSKLCRIFDTISTQGSCDRNKYPTVGCLEVQPDMKSSNQCLRILLPPTSPNPWR
jgi:hypothetical protein